MMKLRLAVHFLTAVMILPTEAFTVLDMASKQHRAAWGMAVDSASRSCLHMNLFDSVSSFLKDREGDFIKLDDSESVFGPGPLILLYNVPFGIKDEEFQDMIADGAPQAATQGVTLDRVTTDLMEYSVGEALDKVLSEDYQPSRSSVITDGDGVPVLLFSGFSNVEMMATYNIMGEEIYKEWGGSLTPACAKAVPNAMEKPLRQVLEEISGDHMHAMSSEETEGTRL